ncbi:hypothetical protein [Chitinophaga costaii]|nr:hypothetical protein [Chitinophaga costaii]
MDPFLIKLTHNDTLEQFRVFPSNLPQGINYLVNIHDTDVRFQTDAEGNVLPTEIPPGIDIQLVKDIGALLEAHHV